MNINENITELVALTKSIIEEFNLAKFRKEVESSFLGLGIDNKDYYHRKMILVLNPIPLQSYHPTEDCKNSSCFQDSELMKKYSDHQAINLAKFAKEVDKSSFLGLGFDSKVTVINPIPLRSYHPVSGSMDLDHENSSSVGKSELINLTAKFGSKGLSGGTFLGLDIDRSSNYKILNQDSDHTTISGLGNNSGSSITTVTDYSGKKRRSPNGNQNNNNNNNNVKKRRRIRSHPEPITPPPEVVQLIGSLIRPVFLYMKKLEESDVRKDQNRLFINEREKLVEFLTEEERISAFGKKDEKMRKPEGVGLIGIDRMGREYKLQLIKWGSLDKLVFNKEWYKIVDANGAKRGDCVHLWGYRKDDKFRLVVQFHHL